MTRTPIRASADDLRVGDVIVHGEGETRVDAIERHGTTVITNPGTSTEIFGHAWNYVYVHRGEQQ